MYVAGNGGVVVIRLLGKTPGESENLVPGCVCDRIGASVCRVARFVPFRFDYCNRYIVGKQEGGGGQVLFFDGIDSYSGGGFLDLMKGGFSAEASGISTVSLLVGFAAAFISGCIACRWMINIVKKGKLIWFALYCAIAGVLTIVLG